MDAERRQKQKEGLVGAWRPGGCGNRENEMPSATTNDVSKLREDIAALREECGRWRRKVESGESGMHTVTPPVRAEARVISDVFDIPDSMAKVNLGKAATAARNTTAARSSDAKKYARAVATPGATKTKKGAVSTSRDVFEAEVALYKLEHELRLSQEKVKHFEAKEAKSAMEVKSIKEQMGQLKRDMHAAKVEAEKARQEMHVAARQSKAFQEELESIQSSMERDTRKVLQLQRAVDDAQMCLSEAEERASAAESHLETEKKRRMELEQRLVEAQDHVSTLKTKLKASEGKLQAEKDAYRAEFEALQHEVMVSHHETRDAKQEAVEFAEQLREVCQVRDELMQSQKNMKRMLEDYKSRLESLVGRLEKAEESAAESTAENLQLRTKLDAGMHDAMEVRALKEVLDNVTASARTKDAELEALKKDNEALRTSSNQLAMEKASLQKQLDQLKDDMSEQNRLHGRDIEEMRDRLALSEKKAEESKGWHPGDATPTPIRIRYQSKIEEASRETRDKMLSELEQERREHIEALRELENSHAAQLEAVMQHAHNNGDFKEALRKLKIVEQELLDSQDKIGHLNSMNDQLKSKCARYKEEMTRAMKRAEKAEQKAQDAHIETQAAKQELVDAQDEVEALLTARLQALSQANSSCDPDENWLTEDLYRDRIEGEGRTHQISRAATPTGSPHKEKPGSKHQSPIKKIANFIRGKKNPTPVKHIARASDGSIVFVPKQESQ